MATNELPFEDGEVPEADKFNLLQPKAHDGMTVDRILDGWRPMSALVQLQEYDGTAEVVRMVVSEAVFFYLRDDNDHDSLATNDGKLVIDALGRRWRRLYGDSTDEVIQQRQAVDLLKAETEAARDMAQGAAVAATSTLNIQDTIADGLADTGPGDTFTVVRGGSDGLTRTTTFRNSSGIAEPVVDPVSGAEYDAAIGTLLTLRDAGLIPLVSANGRVPIWMKDGLLAAVGFTQETRKGIYSDVAGLFDASSARDSGLIPLLLLDGKIPLYVRDGAFGVRAFAPEVLDYLNSALDIAPPSTLEGVASDGRTLRKYRAKTALVREGTPSTVVRVGVTGDSWAELGTPTLKLINLLTTRYTQSPAAFVDLNPGATQQQGVTCTSSGWTLFDSSSGSSPTRSCGPDGQALYATGTSATIDVTGLPGTQITIGYWDGNGTFRYRVDGGSWVSVTGTGANAVAHLQVAGLAAGTHTLDIDLTGNTGTAEVYFALGETPATSGVSVLKMGNGSSTGLNYSTVKTHIAQWSALLALDLLVVMLGTNDSRSANPSSSPATLSQGISDLVGAYRSANADMCGIYIMPPKHGDPVSEGETFEDYADAAIAAADAIGVEWYAAIREWDDNTFEMARGMWQLDHMHLSNPGANRLMAKVDALFLEI